MYHQKHRCITSMYICESSTPGSRILDPLSVENCRSLTYKYLRGLSKNRKDTDLQAPDVNKFTKFLLLSVSFIPYVLQITCAHGPLTTNSVLFTIHFSPCDFYNAVVIPNYLYAQPEAFYHFRSRKLSFPLKDHLFTSSLVLYVVRFGTTIQTSISIIMVMGEVLYHFYNSNNNNDNNNWNDNKPNCCRTTSIWCT